MKTEIIEQEQQTEWKFPCLGKSKMNILTVLFTQYGRGTVISSTKLDLGYYCDVWIMKDFTPITEPTTIKFIP